MRTTKELDPFLDQKKGGGIHPYETEAWEAIEEWQTMYEAMSNKPAVSKRDRAVQEYRERELFQNGEVLERSYVRISMKHVQ